MVLFSQGQGMYCATIIRGIIIVNANRPSIKTNLDAEISYLLKIHFSRSKTNPAAIIDIIIKMTPMIFYTNPCCD
jgi:hypothetical protein